MSSYGVALYCTQTVYELRLIGDRRMLWLDYSEHLAPTMRVASYSGPGEDTFRFHVALGWVDCGRVELR